MTVRKCAKCGKPLYDYAEIVNDFFEYIREQHDDYHTTTIGSDLCLSCAIDEYEEDVAKDWYEDEPDDPITFDPSEPDPYDEDS